MIVALDTMGGDYAPDKIVLGAIKAVSEYDCSIFLVGDREKSLAIIDNNGDVNRNKVAIVGEETAEDIASRIRNDRGWLVIHHATQVIEMDDPPVEAMRKKPDSSLVVATKLVKNNICDAVVSAGSTGGATAIAQIMLRRIKGIGKPSIATPIPTPDGVTLLLDSGAIVDSKPRDLTQMALMGSIYAEKVLGVKSPKVGLLNIGEEETKGNKKMLETYPLMSKMTTINFIGNVEGRDIPSGKADVVICDGFVGNIVLKFGEGLAKTIFSIIKDEMSKAGLLAKIGALLVKPTLMKLGKRLDPDEYGGAPLLGVNGYCIICHGSSNEKSICNAISFAVEYVKHGVVEHIQENLNKEEILADGDI